MWDALVCIAPLVWCRTHSMPSSGLPLLALALGGADAARMLPSSMDTYAWPELPRFAALFVIVDVLQTSAHVLTHTGWLGACVRRHHLVHHRHRTISAAAAFDTGCIDALVQLIIPLLIALAVVEPNRTTAILFGVAFSQWLIHIHEPADVCRAWRLPGLVTPEYHQAHHEGRGHYAHVFAVC